MFQSLGSPNSVLFEQVTTTVNNANKRGMMSFRNCRVGRSCSFGSGSNVSTNLLRREVHGTSLHRLSNPFGDNGSPQRLKMPIEDIVAASSLEAGNIFMGFTNCGRYLLSYTCRPTEHFGPSAFDSDASYMYTLHIWLFTPYSKLRKVCQVCLFDNSGVYDNNLLIEMSQWHMDDNHLLITGHSANPDSEGHYTFYTTVTTIPETRNCPNCVYMHDDELEEDVGSRLRANCILHGLTLHMKYDHVPPYPKLNPDVQLRFKDTILLNTGNVIHMIAFKLIKPFPLKLENTVPSVGLPHNRTTKVPLHCDIWFKIPNANMAALASVKLASDRSNGNDEQNVISLNELDTLLSLFPNSTTSKNSNSQTLENNSTATPCRRLSQSSTDSEMSIFSPKSAAYYCDSGPPMSPPFLNKPRSPRHGNGDYANTQTKGTNVSPSKLMLPPQERKFFKRRLSSHSLGTNTIMTNINSSPTETTHRQSQSPIKTEDMAPISMSATSMEPSSNTNDHQPSESVFDVFEMRLEDTAVERHLSSFKTFRKRRLADKKYEFSDSDVSAENIVPLKMTRRKSKHSQIAGNAVVNPRSPRGEIASTESGSQSPRGSYSDSSHPRSPRAYHFISPVMSPNYDSFSDVLRPLNTNSKIKISALSPNNHQSSNDISDIKMKEEDFTKDFKDNTSQSMEKGLSKEAIQIPSHPHSKATISVHVNCIAKVLRSYIQKDDDNMSVITDIEDELCQGYPFPVALPLDVHGAGYQQLQMISNSKADRFLPVPVVQVLQRTLDIEMLCNEVANLICLASDKLYCSCIDFDLTFADANPDRGTVTAIVVMLVQAMSAKSRTRIERDKCNLIPRKKYETFFACEWIPSSEYCRILYKSNLKELENVPDPWHPTEEMEALIKSHLTVSPPKKTLSNALAVHDWQSLDELSDTNGIITLFKDEESTRLNDRRLNDFENNVDIASLISSTDSEDEWGHVM